MMAHTRTKKIKFSIGCMAHVDDRLCKLKASRVAFDPEGMQMTYVCGGHSGYNGVRMDYEPTDYIPVDMARLDEDQLAPLCSVRMAWVEHCRREINFTEDLLKNMIERMETAERGVDEVVALQEKRHCQSL